MDTGAQLTVMNEKELQVLGIKKDSIFPLSMTVNTVTKSAVHLLGGVFLIFSACDPLTGEIRHTRQLCYISSAVQGIYLSNEACEDLGCVSKQFPEVGQCNSVEKAKIPKSTGKCNNSGIEDTTPCSCPRRELPPVEIPKLPCDPTPENVPKLKQFILDFYKASAFNCCERQPLPLIQEAPPLRLFVDPEATPIAVSKPGVIPLHWIDQVKEGLERDEKLGVVEKVPVNEPVVWCSRMLVTPKHDGTPRRVIDYTQLNKHAPRQTHHTRSPFHIAVTVPGNTFKSVLDNWHGYHSVPIDPTDRALTTFITPFGRYRYKTTPQGLLSAGDGYTQRMGLITKDLTNFESCVDDSIIWDDSIEENFNRVCNFIKTCASAGCIFNPSKFQFDSKEVDFLGFIITATGIKPQDQFIRNIKSLQN